MGNNCENLCSFSYFPHTHTPKHPHTLMKTVGHFLKKIWAKPELAQVSFDVAVLDDYLAREGVSIKRTDTVGRIKTATWSVDFGIAPDEKTIHLPLTQLLQKLPAGEREHWQNFADGSRFSENFLKMQSSNSCIDDGGLRDWGEEDSLF